MSNETFRSGFIAVVGRPNAGKSTLINALVGHKVSIVSDKPQTTRKNVRGILTRPGSFQAIFVDTPGLHPSHNRLGKVLSSAARDALAGNDVVLVVVDVSRPPTEDDRRLAELLRETGWIGGNKPLILALNKMDVLKAAYVQSNYDTYKAMFEAEEPFMISATKQENLDLLLGRLIEQLPEGPLLFEEDDYTDQTVRTIAAELIREKALQKTRQEVPHALAVMIETWEEEEDGLVVIGGVILVERAGQKAIIIGRKGAMLREIGTEARLEIESLLGKKVYLELFVKVHTDWRQSGRMLHELGLDA